MLTDKEGPTREPITGREHKTMSGISIFTCCICGNEFIDRTGHNPWPVIDDDTGKKVCCTVCNATVVIPARMKMAREVEATDGTQRADQ